MRKDLTADKLEILKRLAVEYKDAKPGLIYGSPFELLVATILSAQCTDVRVNVVTAGLFAKYNTPEQFARLSPGELSEYIKSCGLAASKSKNIIETSKQLLAQYDGQVPADTALLQKLPGIGRKTANVVASNAFGIDAIAVDTHVFRVSNRLGLADAKTVEKTEEQLMKAIPKRDWSKAHHWLIWHGRRICAARNPKCGGCFLSDVCRENKQS